jgi:sugar transferase EpsL
MDLAIALPALACCLPLFAAIAVAISLDSPGPVLFRQSRRGLNYAAFTVYKFRTLRHGAPDPHARYETQETDSRITRVGAWLRRWSLDELPQLINVLNGSMSVVGPRPLVEWESAESLLTHAERFAVKPGITGLSQVTVRNAAGFLERLDKDVEYALSCSLRLDLHVLWRTPRAILRPEGVYPNP